jgi:hypothetical protein
MQYVRALAQETIDEIGRADSKAAMLLAGGGILIGTGTSAVLANAGRFSDLPVEIRITLWIALIAAAVGLVFLAVAAYPRTKGEQRSDRMIAYFGDVILAPDPGALRAAIRDSLQVHDEVMVRKLFDLSRIVARKYRYIKLAFGAFSLFLVAGGACVIQSLVLH